MSFIGHGLIKAEWSSETSKFSSCLSTQGTAWEFSKIQEFAQSHTALCWEGQTYHSGCLIPCVVSFPALWQFFSGKRSSVPRHAVNQWRLSSELQPFDFMHIVCSQHWLSWMTGDVLTPMAKTCFLSLCCRNGQAQRVDDCCFVHYLLCVRKCVIVCVCVCSSSANSIFNLQVLKFHFDIFEWVFHLLFIFFFWN